MPLERQHHIVPDGQAAEHARHLKLAADTLADDFILRHTGQAHIRAALRMEDNAACGRFGLAADDVEQRGLACAVRSDEKVDGVPLDGGIDLGQRVKAVKADRNILDIQHCAVSCHGLCSFLRLLRQIDLGLTFLVPQRRNLLAEQTDQTALHKQDGQHEHCTDDVLPYVNQSAGGQVVLTQIDEQRAR